MNCIEIGNKIVNLELVKEVGIVKAQFKGYHIMIDGVLYDTANAKKIYEEIRKKMLQNTR